MKRETDTRVVVAPEWLSYRQGEEYTGLSRTTLWQLINSGEIEAAHVGRTVRISRDSLNDFMRRSASRSADPQQVA